MKMMYSPHIDKYISLVETGIVIVNEDVKKCIDLIKRKLDPPRNVIIEHGQIDKAIEKIHEYFPYELFEWEKFVIALMHCYEADGTLVWTEFLLMMGRGAGKNGFISPVAWYLTTSVYGTLGYNVDIVANSEDQAETSFMDVHAVIDGNKKLQKAFKYSLEKIQNKKTKSTIRFRTSNAKTKDGLRPGCVIFDEIHAYENYDNIKVFTSALGKVSNPRTFYITTNGYVRGSVLDDMLELSESILNGEMDDSRLLPLIFRLDDEKEVHDRNMWQKANPSIIYRKDLMVQMELEYGKIQRQPQLAIEFMTKRMNIPAENSYTNVAEYEKIKATNRPLPDLYGQSCIGAVDYASVRDFCSVGLLFRHDEEWIWMQHTFICHKALELENRGFKFDIPRAEAEGLCTILHEDSIDAKYIVEWFLEKSKEYRLLKVACDSYRKAILTTAFQKVGIPLKEVRNGPITHNKVYPLVEKMFADEKIIFGPDRMMRWYTNNVYVDTDKKGNKTYLKKEPVLRKTDGFFAFIHAVSEEDDIPVETKLTFYSTVTY